MWYGLALGRCDRDLGYGVQFDHIILDANSKDNSLENCAGGLPLLPQVEDCIPRYALGCKDSTPAG